MRSKKPSTGWTRVGSAVPNAMGEWIVSDKDATCALGPYGRLTVHRYMGHGEAWFVSCAALQVDRDPLAAVTLEEACAEALESVRARASAIALCLGAIETPAKIQGGPP